MSFGIGDIRLRSAAQVAHLVGQVAYTAAQVLRAAAHCLSAAALCLRSAAYRLRVSAHRIRVATHFYLPPHICRIPRVDIVLLSHGVNTESLTPDQRVVAAIR